MATLSKLASAFSQEPPKFKQSNLLSIFSKIKTLCCLVAKWPTLQLKKVPLKKLVPIIAKIIMKRKLTSITFPKAGKELKRAFTTNLRPAFLLMTLKGLRARRALNAFKDFNEELAWPCYCD